MPWWPFGKNQNNSSENKGTDRKSYDKENQAYWNSREDGIENRIARIISIAGGATTHELSQQLQSEGYSDSTVKQAIYSMQRDGTLTKTGGGDWWFSNPEQPTGEFGDGLGDYWPE